MTKIEVLDDLGPAPPSATPAPTASAAPAPAEEFITLMRPVTIRIPYGETVLPRGLKLQVISRSGQGINVQYMGKTQTIPADAAVRADR